VNRPGNPPAETTPSAAFAAARTGVLLLDVREAHEWAAGHAPGATHVPLGVLDPAGLDPAVPVVAICRSGNRSGRATATLVAAGFDVRNMAGGMKAWAGAGLPVIRDDGTPGRVV
jgi:rhodanese-related sulfurtransferase